MKEFNKILAAIMVFAMVLGSIPAWAEEGVTITIDGHTETSQGYSSTTWIGMDGTVASVPENEVYAIKMEDGTESTSNVYGIGSKRTGSSCTITVESLLGGISVKAGSGKNAYGIASYFVSDSIVVKELGSITSVASSTGSVYGIYQDSYGGGISVSFSSSGSFLTAESTGTGKVYGVYGRSATDLDVNNLGTLTAKTTNTGSSAEIYGVNKAQVTFTGSGSSLLAESAGTGKVYGVSQGTVKELGALTARTTNAGSSAEIYGIYKAQVTFTGSGSSLTAESAGTGKVYGVNSSNNGTVNSLGALTVTASNGEAYGVAATSGSEEITFSGSADTDKVKIAGKTKSVFVAAQTSANVQIKGDSTSKTKVTFTGATTGSISAIDLNAETSGKHPSVTLTNMDITDDELSKSGNYAISAAGANSSDQSTLTLKNTLLKGNVKLADANTSAKVTLDEKSTWYLNEVTTTTDTGKLDIDTTGTIDIRTMNAETNATGEVAVDLGTGTFTGQSKSKISFDVVFEDGKSVAKCDKIKANTVNGSISLGYIGISGVKKDGSYTATLFDSSSMTGFSITEKYVTKQGKGYNFKQDTTNPGDLKITVENPEYTLPETIQAIDSYGDYDQIAGQKTGFTFSGNITLDEDLGTLVNTDRSESGLTITGNDKTLNAGGKAGVTLGKTGDKMTVNNLTISGFGTFATNSGELNLEKVTFDASTSTNNVQNDGTLNVSGATTFDKGIKDTAGTGEKGTTNIKSGTTTVTGGIIQSALNIASTATLDYKGGTEGTINAVTKNDGTLNVSGTTSFTKGITGTGKTTIVNDANVTVSGGITQSGLGITHESGSNQTQLTFTGDNHSITAKNESESDEACGISINGNGDTSVCDLKTIEAVSGKQEGEKLSGTGNAYGIRNYGVTNASNEFTFTGADSKITAYAGDKGESENGHAYGVKIAASSTMTLAESITNVISGLSSIEAKAGGEVYGIISDGKGSDDAPMNVLTQITFVDTGGTITAESAYDMARGISIENSSSAIGNYVKNINKIKVIGYEDSTTGYGLDALGVEINQANLTLSFTGEDSTIDVKSTGSEETTSSAFGIFADEGGVLNFDSDSTLTNLNVASNGSYAAGFTILGVGGTVTAQVKNIDLEGDHVVEMFTYPTSCVVNLAGTLNLTRVNSLKILDKSGPASVVYVAYVAYAEEEADDETNIAFDGNIGTENVVDAEGKTNNITFDGNGSTVNVAGATKTSLVDTEATGDAVSVDIKGAPESSNGDPNNRTKVAFSVTKDGTKVDGKNITVIDTKTGSFDSVISLSDLDITDDLLDDATSLAISATGTDVDYKSTINLSNTLLKGSVKLESDTTNVKVNLKDNSVFYLGDVTAPDGANLDIDVTDSTLAFTKAVKLAGTTTTLGSGSTLAFYLDGFKAGETIVTSENPISLSNVKVQLWQEKTPLLQKDETLTLLKGAEGNYTAQELKTLHDGQGIQTYKYNTYLESDSLMAQYLGSSGPAEESKSLSEGFIAGSVALMQASDLAAGDAIASAQTAAETASGNSVVPYATIQGGHGRYHTGSHVDMNSTQIAAGVAKKFSDSTTAGLLIEGGDGRYTSYNEFTSGELRADGEVKYYGVGLFARHAFSKSNIGNAYVDAAFSVGRTNQDYRTADIAGVKDYHYDIGVIYLKAHATAGYEWHLGKASLDGYVKYLWACQNGATINFNGQDVNFDTVNSHRVRVGARYTQKIQEALSWYGGLAYEYEFDLSAGANSQGLAIAEPDLKGASGMAEIGLKYSPIKANNWLFDLGLEGFMGKKDSLSVRLSTWYTF